MLEVGAGGGQNFPFYDPIHVVRVEAVEPDEVMLGEARCRLTATPVPIRRHLAHPSSSACADLDRVSLHEYVVPYAPPAREAAFQRGQVSSFSHWEDER